MFSGGQILQPEILPQPLGPPLVTITEQPAPRSTRFRYEVEGRSEIITGVNSTSDRRTFPSIKVLNYQGRAKVVVSCVYRDAPYRPHPHSLVGRECDRGVCVLSIPVDSMSVSLANVGIQCIKRNSVEAALVIREEIAVDPFRTGFAHRTQPGSIKLNAVRLCFQVFREDERTGRCTIPLAPVVSEPIFDKKAVPDLVIVELCSCSAYVDGERGKIILICSKVSKDDIQIRFFEEQDGRLVWEDFGDFRPSEVYNRTAISFRPPRYRCVDITEPVNVYIQLVRPSDGASSEPLRFQFLQMQERRRKKPNLDLNLWQQLLIESQNVVQNLVPVEPPQQNSYPSPMNIQPVDQWNVIPPTCDIDTLLNVNSQEELPPIHISSGDLEMADNNLSDNFQQNLSLSDAAMSVQQNDNLTLQIFRQSYPVYNQL